MGASRESWSRCCQIDRGFGLRALDSFKASTCIAYLSDSERLSSITSDCYRGRKEYPRPIAIPGVRAASGRLSRKLLSAAVMAALHSPTAEAAEGRRPSLRSVASNSSIGSASLIRRSRTRTRSKTPSSSPRPDVTTFTPPVSPQVPTLSPQLYADPEDIGQELDDQEDALSVHSEAGSKHVCSLSFCTSPFKSRRLVKGRGTGSQIARNLHRPIQTPAVRLFPCALNPATVRLGEPRLCVHPRLWIHPVWWFVVHLPPLDFDGVGYRIPTLPAVICGAGRHQRRLVLRSRARAAGIRRG